jgi:hypothetical protein
VSDHDSLSEWLNTVKNGVGGNGNGDLPAPPGSND